MTRIPDSVKVRSLSRRGSGPGQARCADVHRGRLRRSHDVDWIYEEADEEEAA